MAGIFNLFGNISQPEKGIAVKPLSRSKTSLGINSASLKNIGQSKPKGLSIRSNSDLNVPSIVLEHSNKQQECLKLKLTQLDNGGRPISPRKEFSSKKCNVFSSKVKDVSPKKVFDKRNMKSPLLSAGTIFKKPLPPKKYAKQTYPEPEILAPYHDIQFEFGTEQLYNITKLIKSVKKKLKTDLYLRSDKIAFLDNIYTTTMVNEFKDILMKKRKEVVPYKDEGFESDPDQIDVKIPTLRISPKLLNEEGVQCKTPELPEISDNEDDI